LPTYRNTQLVKDLAESLDLALHLIPTLVPETVLVRLFEPDCASFLERADAAEAYPCVGRRDVFDQVFGAQPTRQPVA